MVFSGSSNPALAKKIASLLKVKLGSIELSRFDNDEARVFVKQNKLPKKVIVVQSLSKPTDHHLIEFGLICDALKRKGASDITAIIPWLGYSKQDKVFREGEPLSVKVIAHMLQAVPLSKIITFDLHNPSILGFFEVPVTNLSAQSLLVDHFKSLPNLDETVVVAPDAGAVKSSSAFADQLGTGVIYIDKTRDLKTGKVTVRGLSSSVRGKQALIIDDMVVTGGTLLKTASYLKSKGAISVFVGVTHHLYVPGVQKKIDKSAIDTLVVTNSIKKAEKSKKLNVLNIAPLIATQLS